MRKGNGLPLLAAALPLAAAVLLLGATGDVVSSLPAPALATQVAGVAALQGELWLANLEEAGTQNELVILDAAGQVAQRIGLGAVRVFDLSSDGTAIWALRERDAIVELAPNGQELSSFSTAGSHGIAVDRGRARIWDLIGWEGGLPSNRIRRTDRFGNVDAWVTTTGSHEQWFGLAYDGCSLWTSNRGTATLLRIHPITGRLLGRFGAPASDIVGLDFDGVALLATSTGTDRLYRLEVGEVDLDGTLCTPGFPGQGSPDAGELDAGSSEDGGSLVDSGPSEKDAEGFADSGPRVDAGIPPRPEAGPREDSGSGRDDAGPSVEGDSGGEVDAGRERVDAGEEGGCGCSAVRAGKGRGLLLLVGFLGLHLRRRERASQRV